jgi:arginyl-tRNA---protein transferase
MRYKALYRPQYILGKCNSSVPVSWQVRLLIFKDPDSATWDPLDGELSQKLDKRKYVSLSRDRAREKYDNDDEELPELVDEESLSLFAIQMPGVLSAQDVLAKIDLDHWLLVTYGTFIHMKDLVGWEHANITDPQGIKGIVGELVAVLGVEVAKKSACVLFD